MAFTKIAAAGIGSTETVTLHSLEVLNNAPGGGVLTYEDVTNVDSIGIVTARAGVLVGSGITLSKDGDIFATGVTTATKFVGDGSELTGVASTDNIRTNTNATFLQNINVSGTSTIGGDVNIADKIVHIGDTDTAIRFSDADTISFETGGTTRAKITSVGNLEMPNDNDYIKIGAGGDLQLVHSGSASFISNSTGFLEIQAPTITFENTSGTERARISSNGKLLVGTTAEAPYTTRLLTVGDTSFDDTAIEIRSSSTTGRLYFTDSASAGEGAYQGELTFEHTSGNNRMHTKIGNTTKISVTGDGLTFNGDTAAANALDDYEEGTFTPRLGGSNNSGTYYVEGTGTYIKIGRKVSVSIRFNAVNLDDNASGNAMFLNMPFTAGHAPTNGVSGVTQNVQYYNVPFSTTYISNWYISSGANSWNGLVSRSNTTWDNFPVSDFHAANLYLNLFGTYFTA